MPDFSHIKLPPEEERELVQLLPVPSWYGIEPRKAPRDYSHMRGPELINNDLVYGQFGIMAVTGCNLTIDHLNMIRTVVNKHMDKKRMFAVWRVEAPWKPISKKAQGKRMGGGKSAIHHYATPIRAGSVIVELGGHIELEDCQFFLESLAKRMPCQAFVVSKELLEQWRQEELAIEQQNINPLSYQRVVQQNMSGCHRWITPYDHRWYGKYT
ncbi:PREDICTED: 39S ribosomal protein L16, mitochondrial-like [Rhagoletis zephyria]|uniref:39S ribosomal protein L16, mitochondrial-like n=1 Tax=Rhagoletis zephyria TaxID=28612 RepID=UPI000811313F|nr:PREDICTED: 39S ribosomal protein L16, mitochondrial-like [Rhagoletis zephyria]